MTSPIFIWKAYLFFRRQGGGRIASIRSAFRADSTARRYKRFFRSMTNEVMMWLRGLLDRLAYPERYPESCSSNWHSGDGPFEEWANAIAEEYKRGPAPEPAADSTPLERAFAKEPERSIADEALRKIGALEDTPFLPIKPEVLQAFSKQMVDWGVVWVKYSADGAKVIPHEEIYESPPNRGEDS